LSARELLERHNPVLIILPEDTSRNRPGAVTRGRGRGDYHPCSAELLLSLVIWRARPKPWLLVPLLRLLPRFKEAPIDLAELKLKAEAADPASTAAWELDIEPIRSQNSRQAWSAYRKIRARPELAPYLQPVVYGRLAPGRDGPVLQYWYLYVYNDFWNNHEADWEMATVHLGDGGEPVGALELVAAELDDADAQHASPAVSGSPSITFMFWIACPAPPFTRLSIAAITVSRGRQTFATGTTPMATRFRCTTSLSAGRVPCITTTQGSSAYTASYRPSAVA